MARAATATMLDEMTDPLAETFRDQLAQAEAPTPDAPSPLVSERRFIFRSYPGTIRQYNLRIPGVPTMREDQKKDEAIYQARYEKHYTAEERALHARLRETVGDLTIHFTTISHITKDDRIIRECHYQTDDPEVAAFIRAHIAGNDALYEDLGALKLRCEFCDATFPNNPDGMKKYNAHLSEQHGG